MSQQERDLLRFGFVFQVAECLPDEFPATFEDYASDDRQTRTFVYVVAFSRTIEESLRVPFFEGRTALPHYFLLQFLAQAWRTSNSCSLSADIKFLYALRGS